MVASGTWKTTRLTAKSGFNILLLRGCNKHAKHNYVKIQSSPCIETSSSEKWSYTD